MSLSYGHYNPMDNDNFVSSPLDDCLDLDNFITYFQHEDSQFQNGSEDYMLYPFEPLNANAKNSSDKSNQTLSLPSPLSPFEPELESPIYGGSPTGASDTSSDLQNFASPTYCLPSLDFLDLQACETKMSLSPNAERRLTPAEIKELYSIAMPNLISPADSFSPAQSPEFEEGEEEEWQPKTSLKTRRQQAGKSTTKAICPPKTTHNLIEKRYRNKINDQFAALRENVPCLRGDKGSKASGSGEDMMAPQRVNKAMILSKAIEYIRELEGRNKVLMKEHAILRSKGTESQKPTFAKKSYGESMRSY